MFALSGFGNTIISWYANQNLNVLHEFYTMRMLYFYVPFRSSSRRCVYVGPDFTWMQTTKLTTYREKCDGVIVNAAFDIPLVFELTPKDTARSDRVSWSRDRFAVKVRVKGHWVRSFGCITRITSVLEITPTGIELI